MPDIMVVLACVSQCVALTTLRQLGRVIEAMLSISGRVTMKGLSRWSGPGGSYRTIQRLFTTSVHWCQRNWLLIRHHLLDANDVVLMSGAHVVVTKSGQTTYGCDRFFSSLYGKAVPGLCFLSLSLLSVKRRTSYPVVTEQVEKPCETSGQTPPKKQTGGSRGRPKGSKNRQRREVTLSPSLCFIHAHIQRLLEQIGEAFKVVYFIFDGEFGHNDALQMVRQVGLHLISKLRYTSALYVPYDGPYSGRGPRRKYGQKLDDQHMPSEYLQATSIDKEIKTQIYHLSLWHKKFAQFIAVCSRAKPCEIGENLLSVSNPISRLQERLIHGGALIRPPTLQRRSVSGLHPYAAVERWAPPMSPVPEPGCRSVGDVPLSPRV